METEKRKQYYLDNREQKLKYQKKYNKKNKAKIKAYKKAWYLKKKNI